MEDLLYNSTAEGKIIHTFFVKVMAISKKCKAKFDAGILSVSYTHLRAHETVLDLVCRLLLEKKKN